MEAAYTVKPGDDRDHFMVIASREEWAAIVRNVDGIGHSPETMALLAELAQWGIRK